MDGFCCSSPIIHAHVVPKRIDSGRKLQNDKIGYVFVLNTRIPIVRNAD